MGWRAEEGDLLSPFHGNLLYFWIPELDKFKSFNAMKNIVCNLHPQKAILMIAKAETIQENSLKIKNSCTSKSPQNTPSQRDDGWRVTHTELMAG